MQLPIHLEIALLGIYLREIKTYIQTKNLHINVYSHFIANKWNLETTQMLFNRWMVK